MLLSKSNYIKGGDFFDMIILDDQKVSLQEAAKMLKEAGDSL